MTFLLTEVLGIRLNTNSQALYLCWNRRQIRTNTTTLNLAAAGAQSCHLALPITSQQLCVDANYCYYYVYLLIFHLTAVICMCTQFLNGMQQFVHKLQLHYEPRSLN